MKIFRLEVLVSDTRGYSMIELLVVLSIASILLAIGVPSFSAVIQNQRLTTTSNAFFMALNLARSEAIRRGARVDVAPADGRQWAQGWVVFIDHNHNQKPDSGDQIIFSHGPISKGMVIKSAFTDSSKEYLAYNGSGRTRTNASNQSPQLGTVSFVLNERVRRIKLNFLGRPRTCNPESDSTCTGSSD